MHLRTRAFRNLGAAAVVCALAAACTQPGPVTPTPSPTLSPVDTTPSETQLERQTRLDFQAAEKAYRAFQQEYDRVAAAGGTDRPTPAMSYNAAGPYLKTMTRFLTQNKNSGQSQRGSVRVAYVHRGAYSPEQLNLDVCEDGTKVETVAKDGSVIRGVAVQLQLYVRRVDGRWKIWNGDDKKVQSCG